MYMKSHEEMIQSLYARREAYERKKAKGKRATIRVTGIAACFVLCTAVLWGSYGQSEPPVTPSVSEEPEQSSRGESLTEESSEGDLSEGESEVVSEPSGEEPPAWLDAAYASYAVVDLLEITDDTIIAEDGTEYTAVKCNVINSYRAEEFAVNGWVYIVTPSAQKMSKATTVFFELEKMTVGDELYYTTSMNTEGALCMQVDVGGDGPELEFPYNSQDLIKKINETGLLVSSFLKEQGCEAVPEISFGNFTELGNIENFFLVMSQAVERYQKEK